MVPHQGLHQCANDKADSTGLLGSIPTSCALLPGMCTGVQMWCCVCLEHTTDNPLFRYLYSQPLHHHPAVQC